MFWTGSGTSITEATKKERFFQISERFELSREIPVARYFKGNEECFDLMRDSS